MTKMLVDYVGPIAKNIMKAQYLETSSINELASVVSREIPQQEERKAFLRRWEQSTGTRIEKPDITATRLISSNNKVRTFDDEMLEKIRENYTEYIGPIAARLVQYYSKQTNSLEQLVNELAEEIPDAKDSQAFRKQWLQT